VAVGWCRCEPTPPSIFATLSGPVRRVPVLIRLRPLRPTWLCTLRSNDFVRRVVAVNKLKFCLLVVASGLCLLALAVLIVLTNTAALVVTLAIMGTIVFLLVRRGLAEARGTNSGR